MLTLSVVQHLSFKSHQLCDIYCFLIDLKTLTLRGSILTTFPNLKNMTLT